VAAETTSPIGNGSKERQGDIRKRTVVHFFERLHPSRGFFHHLRAGARRSGVLDRVGGVLVRKPRRELEAANSRAMSPP
jgi:hypothetical protein